MRFTGGNIYEAGSTTPTVGFNSHNVSVWTQRIKEITYKPDWEFILEDHGIGVRWTGGNMYNMNPSLLRIQVQVLRVFEHRDQAQCLQTLMNFWIDEEYE